MKNKKQCPICYEELDIKDCTPCDECGHLDEELEHFRENKHTYHLVEVFGRRIKLCNFCMLDFGSYHPKTFGEENIKRVILGSKELIEVKQLYNEKIQKDYYCKKCNSKINFVNILFEIKKENSTELGLQADPKGSGFLEIPDDHLKFNSFYTIK